MLLNKKWVRHLSNIRKSNAEKYDNILTFVTPHFQKEGCLIRIQPVFTYRNGWSESIGAFCFYEVKVLIAKSYLTVQFESEDLKVDSTI